MIKAKLVCKQYEIVVMGIPIAKIVLEKGKETREKIAIKNTTICTGMKIEGIFWLSILKKDKRILLLVIKVDNIKIVNILIEKTLIFDHTLYRCIIYNPVRKIKQWFNCYKYNHGSVYY